IVFIGSSRPATATPSIVQEVSVMALHCPAFMAASCSAVNVVNADKGQLPLSDQRSRTGKNSGVPAGTVIWLVLMVSPPLLNPGGPRNRTRLAGPLQMPGSPNDNRWLVDCPRAYCHHLADHSS